MENYFLLGILTIAIFSQGILILADVNNDELDVLICKRRLIDYSPNSRPEVPLQLIPYIVNIQKNELHQCGGSILSAIFILTAAHCVIEIHAVYHVLSNSEDRNSGIRHDIKWKIIHPDFHPPAFLNDLALLRIFPPIDLVHSRNEPIPLRSLPVLPNTIGSFSGWGCTNYAAMIEGIFPNRLRSIRIRTIKLKDCQTVYHNITPVTDKNFCIRDNNMQKRSCHGDSGGPFVIDGRLAGLMSWSMGYIDPILPDIFVHLLYPEYHQWISLYVPQPE